MMHRQESTVSWFAAVAPAPVHLIVESPQAPTSLPWWVLPVVFTAAAACAALVGIGAAARRKRRRNSGELAFRRLVVKMHIPTAMAALVQRLAASHPGATPTAILMSDDALRAAAAEFLKSRPSKRELRLLEELIRSRGLAMPTSDAPRAVRLARSA
jgi:hypothetical protein